MNGPKIYFTIPLLGGIDITQTTVSSFVVMVLLCTAAVVLGMTVNDVSGQAIANLGWKDIALTNPVFAGDTLYAESEVLDKRESKSRPTQGIVTVRTKAFNQKNEQIMVFDRTFLVAKEGHGVGDK